MYNNVTQKFKRGVSVDGKPFRSLGLAKRYSTKTSKIKSVFAQLRKLRKEWNISA